MAQFNFDASQVAPQMAYEPLPNGWYTAMITASEMKPTNDGQGQYLKLEFTVCEGAHQNRKVYTNLNLVNHNPMAVEIAYRQLSAICHSVGHLRIQNDTNEIHGKPMAIRVKVEQQEGRDAQNAITGFKAYDPQATHATPTAPTAPAFAGMPPAAPVVAPAAPAFQPPQPPAFQQPQAPAAAPAAPVQPWEQPVFQQPAPPAFQQPQAPAFQQPAAAIAPPGITQPAPAASGFAPPWQQPQQ